MNKLEFRTLELRAVKEEDTSKMIVEGTVNNIGELSKVLYGSFREKIEKDVFTRALAKAKKAGKDIFFLALHNTRELPIASINSGSMVLKEEKGKLKIRAELANTTLSRDVYELVKAGILTDFSFGFNNAQSTWTKDEDGIRIRNITELDLHEVSVVTTGAYNNTEINARSLELSEIMPNEDKENETETEPNKGGESKDSNRSSKVDKEVSKEEEQAKIRLMEIRLHEVQ